MCYYDERKYKWLPERGYIDSVAKSKPVGRIFWNG